MHIRLTPHSARSALLRQAQRKDALIASLLRHVYSTMSATADSDDSMSPVDEEDAQETASAGHATYLEASSAAGQDTRESVPARMPSPAFAQACSQLELVRSGAVSVDEIDSLFHM